MRIASHPANLTATGPFVVQASRLHAAVLLHNIVVQASRVKLVVQASRVKLVVQASRLHAAETAAPQWEDC